MSQHQCHLGIKITPENLNLQFEGTGEEFSYIANLLMVCKKEDLCLEEFKQIAQSLQKAIGEAHKH